jgi:integrase
LGPCGPETALLSVDLLDYRLARLDAKKRKPKDVSKDMVRLRAVLRAAKKKGKIGFHVFETLEGSEKTELFGVWRPTPESSKGRPITAEDWTEILRVFPEEDFNRCLRFLRATGCRLDQAASLEWSSFRDMPLPGFQLLRQKKADRFVPMTQVLREIAGDRQSAGLVFGNASLYGRLQRAWRYRVRAMSYRIHDIRHTAGTALRDSAGVENGASALGVTPAMMGIYGEHDRDLRNASVLAAIQTGFGTYGATFPKPFVSQRDAK